ncbi:MAG: helix-turn-helix domain-containing protein [Rickettsiales bacterium]
MAKKFRRNHNIRHIKQTKAYTVEEAAKCLNVGQQAVYSWIKQGMPTIEGIYPKLVHGSAIIDYLKKQRESRKIKCQPDEFCCFKCKVARKPLADSITQKPKGKKAISLSAICSVCACKMFKVISAKNTS